MIKLLGMKAVARKYKYTELIRELALTGFKLKYHGSFFGYLWSLMKPLFLFLVLYLVFNNFFKLGKAIPNYPIYLLIGITLWGFFMETTSMCMGIIVGSGDLIRKIYFPRIVLPIATSLTAFLTLIVNLFVVFGFMIVLRVPVNFELVYLPIILLEYYLFTLGVSLFLSAVYVKFRDIGPIWEVAGQVLFYATPIIYSLSLVPQRLAAVMMINPLAQIIQGGREAILPTEVVTAKDVLGVYWFLPIVVALSVFCLGYFVFQKMTAKFAEEV
jgi:ABC-2 type transport system permease protein